MPAGYKVSPEPVKNQTHNVLALLRQYESRNVTYIEAGGSWPIVWNGPAEFMSGTSMAGNTST